MTKPKPLMCAICKRRPATGRLTVDLDIHGLLVCDDEGCVLRGQMKVWDAMTEGMERGKQLAKGDGE